MRKTIMTYGFNAKDVKVHCMKTFYAQVEIVLFSTGELKQRRIWKRCKKY